MVINSVPTRRVIFNRYPEGNGGMITNLSGKKLRGEIDMPRPITPVVIVIYGRYAYVRWKRKPVKKCLHGLSSESRVNVLMNLIKILTVALRKKKNDP